MKGIKRRLGVLPLMALAAAGVGVGPASAAIHRIAGTRAEWQAAIARAPEPGAGCYHASYPAVQWHAVRCVVAPTWPMAPALPSGPGMRTGAATVGGGLDYAARVSGLISKATGSFRGVSSKITEKGKVGNKGSEVANAFSLQLNTQFFSSSPACSGSSDPSRCLAWQQFLYATSTSGQAGLVYMQYWLINYDTTCPPDWFTYTGTTFTDCYANSSASSLPGGLLTARQLASVKLSGSAARGGNDKASLTIGSGQATLVSNSDSMLDLARFWNQTEWGVFGDGGGGEAFFGTNTTLEAQTTLTATSSSAPTCIGPKNAGTTAETNNLKLTSTPALGSGPSPTMASKQTNGTSGTASCAAAK